MSALPCPFLVPVISIHGAPLDASHVQSRVVVTWSMPVAPAAGALSSELPTPTWHLVLDGALTESSVELQPAASTMSMNHPARHAPSTRGAETGRNR